MIYLEQNAPRIKELQTNASIIKPGEKRGEGSMVEFYSAGSYFSDAIGRELYLGIKVNKNYQNATKKRPIYELSAIAAIAESIPNGLDYLPEIYGLMVDSTGNNVGIITEDFSQNGEFDVRQSGGAYMVFEDAFGKDVIDEAYSSNAGFTITPPNSNFIEKNGNWAIYILYGLLTWTKNMKILVITFYN